MKNRSLVFYSLVLTGIANCFLLVRIAPWVLLAFVPLFLLVNIFAGMFTVKSGALRLRLCIHGAVLLHAFLNSTVLSVLFHFILWLFHICRGWQFFGSAALCFAVEAIIFWNGMLCVYFTSTQLGIKLRVAAVLCGMIPLVNLLVLRRMLRVLGEEVRFESEKERCNLERRDMHLCATKYPLLLVHGVFFRDSTFFNYWGRIPKELERNGAVIYYGMQPSAASVEDCAGELSKRIRSIVEETGCEKVNIIAHSKGGLDCRYAVSKLNAAPYVASLTTVNTPHRGCEFAEYLLNRAPEELKNEVTNAYNSTLRKIGEQNPDFMAAVTDLTASVCTQRDRELGIPEGIFCQSVGSVLKKPSGGKFPLNLSYYLVNYFDGPNDGLVSADSFGWGEKYMLLETEGTDGISHGDIIDLGRMNKPEFDVREFYVRLVADLKERGL